MGRVCGAGVPPVQSALTLAQNQVLGLGRGERVQDGLQPGGLNFDCKVRRESTDLADMFIGHVGAMDTFAKGLKGAAQMKKDGTWDKMLKERYSSYDKGIGQKIEAGQTSFKDLEDYIHKNGEAKRFSGQQELYEVRRPTSRARARARAKMRLALARSR